MIDDCDDVVIKNSNFDYGTQYLYIKETRRHFIENIDSIYTFSKEVDGTELFLIVVDFQAAWGIEAESLSEISKKYNVDFKIYAFECGMCFNQDIEIIKGEIIKDEEIQFEDYYWECIDPTMGG